MPNPISPNARWYDPTTLTEKMKTPEAAACPHCKCEFLEQITVQKFPKTHNVILGQRVQPIYDVGFHLFRCLKCKELLEPEVQAGATDATRRMYDELLDTLEGVETTKGNSPETL